MHRKHLTELIIGIVVVVALAVAVWAAHVRASAGATGQPGVYTAALLLTDRSLVGSL
jgi:ABC-type transporter Mla subunit MlaD